MKKGIISLLGLLSCLFIFEGICPKTGIGALPEGAARQERIVKQNPDIRQIEKALKAIKRNRDGILAVSRAVSSKANRALARSFPDVCKNPSAPSAGPVPIPYPNIGLASQTASGSTKVKNLADKAVVLKQQSEVKKSEGDEIGTSVKRLEEKVGKVLARRALSLEEKKLFRKEWTDSVERATRLVRMLDQYIAEVEGLLEESKKELGIKIPY
jgi:hypothetical protein